MKQKNGIPQRVKLEDKPKATRIFVKQASIIWLIGVAIFAIEKGLNRSNYFTSESGIIDFIASVWSLLLIGVITFLPIIIFFAIVLKLIEKGFKKISE